MADNTAISALRHTWESAAPGWAQWEERLAAGLSDATETLMDMAGIEPGMRVLDLACGAGSQTLQAARRVGPTGRVVACDISATMLDHVRRNAAAAGLKNVETLESAAEEIDTNSAPFDAAISRLGLMLFAAPGEVIGAVRRVLKPGARFAALVVGPAADNPVTAEPLAILMRRAGKTPPPPGQPGLYALGGPGVLAALLNEGGLAEVGTQPVSAPLKLASASDAVAMMQEAFGVYRALVADMSEPDKARAWDEVSRYLTGFETGDGFDARIELLVGAGTNPG